MKIAVLGGTGRTGWLVVEAALAAGHEVKILAREPRTVPTRPRLEVIAGDAVDGGRVMACLVGCEAAVIALGATKAGPVDVCSRATEHVVAAAAKVGLRHIVAITSLGVGDSAPDVPAIFKLIAALFLKKVMADKDQQEALLRSSTVAWTILRPSGLVEADPGPVHSGVGRLAQALPTGTKVRGQVSRASVARLAIQALTEPTWAGQTRFVTA